VRDLEKRALETLYFQISFYIRFVDDIAMAIPSSSVNDILKVFKGFHPRLQFTVEIGGHQLNFVDVITKVNNFFEFNWYHEPTFSGRCLSFLSQHFFSLKKEAPLWGWSTEYLFFHVQDSILRI